MRKSPILILAVIYLYSCNTPVEKSNSNDSVKTVLQTNKTDSSNNYFKDELTIFYDCNNPRSVIRKTKPVSKQLFIEIKNDKSIAIKKFVEESFGQFDTSSNKGLLDLDNDNIPELLITYYTGGNHCCDGIWIGKKVNDSLYEEAFAIEGGSITMNDKKIFRCIQDERLGYFYSSYACSGDYEFPYDYSATDIQFKYKKGSLVYISDVKNRNQLIQNLSFLSKIPVPPLSEIGGERDCIGYRKSFAKNIVALYINDKFDTVSTKKVFYNYYKGADIDTVWNEVVEYLDPALTVYYLKRNLAEK